MRLTFIAWLESCLSRFSQAVTISLSYSFFGWKSLSSTHTQGEGGGGGMKLHPGWESICFIIWNYSGRKMYPFPLKYLSIQSFIYISMDSYVFILCAFVLSCVWFFATQGIVACWASLSIEFSGQEYWSGLPFPSPGDLLTQGLNPGPLCFLHYRRILYLLSHQGSPWWIELYLSEL